MSQQPILANAGDVFDMSCQLADVTQELLSIKDQLEKLGLVPGQVDITKISPRRRKKALQLYRHAQTLYERGASLQAKLVALGVPVQA